MVDFTVTPREVSCPRCGYQFKTRGEKVTINCPSCQIRFKNELSTKYTRNFELTGIAKKEGRF